jgi:hypothetical protein
MMNQTESATAETQISDEEIARVESLVEAGVQRSLESLDAWKLFGPLRGDRPGQPIDPAKCTKEKHKCELHSVTTPDTNNICGACLLYKRIVMERSSFPVGGRSDACDYMSGGIADPLIFAFIKNGDWLKPASHFTGAWFVKHPITYFQRAQSSMAPVSQAGIRRNQVRLYEAHALLAKLGIQNVDATLGKLHGFWQTEAGGIIYSYDELLDTLGPIATIATCMHNLSLDSTTDMIALCAGARKLMFDE